MKYLNTILNLILLPLFFLTHFTKNHLKNIRKIYTVHVFSFVFILALIAPSQTQAADAYDAQLSITTSASVNAGEELTYNVTIASGGGKIKKDIVVTNTFDVDFSYVSATNWACSKTGQTVICTSSSDINNNASSDFSFIIIPTANGTTTSITNDANISSVGNSDADTDISNNAISFTTTVNPVVDLSVTKTASKATVGNNEAFTYTLVATNNGRYPDQNITITDTLPSGVI